MKNVAKLVCALSCVTACTAQISGPSHDEGATAPGLLGNVGASPGSSPMTGGGSSATGGVDPNAAGPMPLRRLSQIEYDNTVADLVADRSQPARDFPPDGASDSPFPSPGDVDSLLASRFAEAAQALATAADLTKLLPCQPSPDEAGCAARFVDDFGGKAFRRPVLPGERDRLLGVYHGARMTEGLDFDGGIRSVIEAALQSAPFLYHWELGPQPAQREAGAVRLGPYEVASRLSYFLWGSMPDTELLSAARDGKLSTEADVRAAARRLLESPRAERSIETFFSQWLGLDQLTDRTKDAASYPEFDDDLKTAMLGELDALTQGVMLHGDGRLETWLTSNQAVVGGPLAKLYGIDASADGNKPVALDPAERSGFLTRAGFQALFGGPKGSNPIKRGVEIYRRLMCGIVPKPPANVPPPKEASEGGTTRMRLAEHSQNECAKGCHSLFDGIGYAFENYDGIGRYRTTDNALPVDASASVLLDGQEHAFKNGIELSQLLAHSAQVKRCLASQVASFGLGRAPQDADGASIDAAVMAYSTGTGGIRDLLTALAASRAFRYRAPADGETLP